MTILKGSVAIAVLLLLAACGSGPKGNVSTDTRYELEAPTALAVDARSGAPVELVVEDLESAAVELRP